MSVSAFKYLTIQGGGTPQPLIGTWLTAAVTSPQGDGSTTVSVNDTSMFAGASYAVFTDPATYAAERVRVSGIVNSTTMTVQGLRKPHPGGAYGTGAWVGLSDPCQQIYVQGKDGNSGALFIGTGPQMATATGAQVIAKIVAVTAGTQPTEFSTSRDSGLNAETVSQYWIDGTSNDSYLPSLGKV